MWAQTVNFKVFSERLPGRENIFMAHRDLSSDKKSCSIENSLGKRIFASSRGARPRTSFHDDEGSRRANSRSGEQMLDYF